MNQKQRALKLRKALTKVMSPYKNRKVAVLMSSGVDSHSVLFAALEAGAKVELLSFSLDDRQSRDCAVAESTAAAFDLKFHRIDLPSDVPTLIEDVKYMVGQCGAVKKTHIECFWPMMYAIDKVSRLGIHHVGTGHGADNYYCLSRKANQHYKDKPDEYRALSFNDPHWSQKSFIQAYGKSLGKQRQVQFLYPYHTRSVFNVFTGASIDELNKPKQKYITRLAFEDYFENCKVYNHQPFQLGDSGITEHFEKLLDTDLNTGGYKSVVGVYNSLKRELLGEAPIDQGDED